MASCTRLICHLALELLLVALGRGYFGCFFHSLCCLSLCFPGLGFNEKSEELQQLIVNQYMKPYSLFIMNKLFCPFTQ